MRVRFEIDGGFVYLPTENNPVTIDTNELPAEEANEVKHLVEAAGFFGLPETSEPPSGAADYFQYTISVTAGERSHTVRLIEPIEDRDVQALVEYLEGKLGEPRAPQ